MYPGYYYYLNKPANRYCSAPDRSYPVKSVCYYYPVITLPSHGINVVPNSAPKPIDILLVIYNTKLINI